MAQLNKHAIIIFGNQLLKDHPAISQYPDASIIMIESYDLFSKLPYHKHKLMLIMASMRNYRDQLLAQNKNVIYFELKKDTVFKKLLGDELNKNNYSKMVWMKTSDKSPNQMLQNIANDLNISYEILENKQFLTPLKDLDDWFHNKNSPIMDSFYKWQRKRMNVLIEDGKPTGGSWSYDSLNRKPLPKNIILPKLPSIQNKVSIEITKTIESLFASNLGDSTNFWLPTTHEDAQVWLNDFITYRLNDFGPYEDAMQINEPFLFHSVLSPLLNIGLLTPQEVIEKAERAYQNKKVSLNSYEGFVRQIIGWREYMFGLYMFHQDKLDNNFFNFNKPLEDWWFTGIPPENLEPPLKEALSHVFTYGYNHHIERLMILGNWFLLNSYNPYDVYKWFSAMYVDAYEWVMLPNVLGMSQYADGGFTATKPYISGGNYLQKMGKWWPSLEDAKNSAYTKLYWNFLNTHYPKLKNNPRMSLVLAQAKHKTTSTKGKL